MKKFWIKKALMILLFGTAAVLLFGWIVMSLWNGILPVVITGVKTISFLQALGLLLLSKILFGGFGGGGWRGKARHKERWMQMQQKLAAMTPEERERFKSEWKNRCGGRWGMHRTTDSSTNMAAE